jgi:hypothetical protein
MISVVYYDGKWFALGNRRLWLAKYFNKPITCKFLPSLADYRDLGCKLDRYNNMVHVYRNIVGHSERIPLECAPMEVTE